MESLGRLAWEPRRGGEGEIVLFSTNGFDFPGLDRDTERDGRVWRDAVTLEQAIGLLQDGEVALVVADTRTLREWPWLAAVCQSQSLPVMSVDPRSGPIDPGQVDALLASAGDRRAQRHGRDLDLSYAALLSQTALSAAFEDLRRSMISFLAQREPLASTALVHALRSPARILGFGALCAACGAFEERPTRDALEELRVEMQSVLGASERSGTEPT